jgi:hypothetical protein
MNCCQASLVEIDLPKSAAVEADRIAAQLQLHKAPVVSAATVTQAQSETGPEAKSTSTSEAVPVADIQAVDVNSLELVRPRSVGVEQFGLWAMRQVDFSELLRELELTRFSRLALQLAERPVPTSRRTTLMDIGTASGWLSIRFSAACGKPKTLMTPSAN